MDRLMVAKLAIWDLGWIHAGRLPVNGSEYGGADCRQQ
jgi:hypothetical protein